MISQTTTYMEAAFPPQRATLGAGKTSCRCTFSCNFIQAKACFIGKLLYL